MQPSVPYCKYCGWYPADFEATDDYSKFAEEREKWKQKGCPVCGNHKFIRKAYYKL